MAIRKDSDSSVDSRSNMKHANLCLMAEIEDKVTSNLNLSFKTPSDSTHSSSDEDDNNDRSYKDLMQICN